MMPILPTLIAYQAATGSEVQVVDWWGYFSANPFALLFLVLVLTLVGLLIVIIVFRWYEVSFQHSVDRQYLQMVRELHDQEILNMQANREEQRQFNQAIVRQLNASATLLEQTANTIAIVNQLLAAKGGVSIAIEAARLVQADQGQGQQK